MSPNASEARGFSLAEVLVALAVAGVLGVAVVRFYKDSYRTFSVQEQVTERDQNAHYVVNKFVEILQQAGAGLPDTGWSVITLPGGNLNIGVNPRGAEHFNGIAAAASNFVTVADAAPFKNTGNVLLNTTHVLIDFANPASATRRYAIDLAYNQLGFVNGIKDNSTRMDSIRLTTAVSLAVGDRVFGYREDLYLLSGGNLVVRPNGSPAAEMVLAENIDSLAFSFLDARGNPTTDWRIMRSASFAVRARTPRPDPRLPPPGYRRIVLPMNVSLRGRI
jgi:prepilin-type N-terminal cleavage/methylation domain-containing protein